MNKLKTTLALIVFAIAGIQYTAGQEIADFSYVPNASYPFGRYNPEAPSQLLDFDPLIGICDCQSVARNPDGTWQDTTVMIWKFKYIMNGWAVQDETFRDGFFATGIRQVNPDSAKWTVTYSSSNSAPYTVPVWVGDKKDGNIVLYRDQVAPNGMVGYYKITFFDISSAGFNWKGEWVNADESIVFPTWHIICDKRT